MLICFVGRYEPVIMNKVLKAEVRRDFFCRQSIGRKKMSENQTELKGIFFGSISSSFHHPTQQIITQFQY